MDVIGNPLSASQRRAHQFDLLEQNIDILHKLAEALLEKETVMGAELDELILKMRPGIMLPSIRKVEAAAPKDPEIEEQNPV